MILFNTFLITQISVLSILHVIDTQMVTSRSFEKYGSGVKLATITQSTIANSKVECCDICAKTDDCVLANFNVNGHECHLSDVDAAVDIVSTHTLVDGWHLYFDAGDECATSPCMNGGTCADLIGRYFCDCVDGWAGDTCNQAIDECSSDPCENGGTCSDQVNAYTCSCVTGYVGTNCETNTDECTGNQCMNGGTCVDLVNAYTCSCVPGYEGNNCQTDTDDCTGDPCTNDGTCVDQVNAYTCLCVSGYVGTMCETDTDDCAGDPCKNGGSCVDQVNAYTCSCVGRYGGTNCETFTSCVDTGMVLANNQCYYFSSGAHSRADSDWWCNDKKNSHLADITSEAELESVKLAYENEIGTGVSHTVWIGGNDISVEGTLVWYDGTPVVGGYTRWGSAGLNNNDDNDCIAVDLSANWTWTMANCATSYHYVAEEYNDN